MSRDQTPSVMSIQRHIQEANAARDRKTFRDEINLAERRVGERRRAPNDPPSLSGNADSIFRKHIVRSQIDRRQRDYERRTAIYMLPWWKRLIRNLARKVLK
jgi:hypothetical protein